MKELPHDPQHEQVHTDAAPEQEQTGYSLEEIMREFGGWSKPEPEPQPQPEPEPQPEPQPEQESQAQTEPPADEAETPPAVTGDTIRFAPIESEPEPETEPQIWTYKGEPIPGELSQEQLRAAERLEKKKQRERLRAQKKHERRKKRAKRRQEQPERVFRSAEEAYRAYSHDGSRRTRMGASLILCLLSAAMLFFLNYSMPKLELGGSVRLLSAGMLILMLGQAFLAYEVCLRGALQLLRGRFDHRSLLLLLILVVTLDTAAAIAAYRVPMCTVVSVLLLISLWGETLHQTAKRRTMKAVCGMEHPLAAVREEKAWHGKDCIFRADADVDAFLYQLELPDATGRIMRIYAPTLAIVTLILSVLTALRRGDFLWSWSAMLLAGYPAGMLFAYAKPFCMYARRMLRSGAAVAGWQGAKNLGGECGIAIEDADLFPPENVTLNGMKIYSDRNLSQIAGYAAAVVETAGSGLIPLFREILKNQNGRRYSVDAFRRYEGGGLGAEIGGDVILMGALGFMKLMRVQMPEGTRLKQAVYLAINGELAAVFALNYAPASAVKSCLSTAVRMTGLLPILATRDFMITPQFLKHRYKTPPERIEFPTVEERARLSSPQVVREPKQGALLAHGNFACFFSAVIGARIMRSATRGATLVSILGGILGAGILFLLMFIGSTQAVSAWNLLLYVLLWLLPSLLITTFGGTGGASA